MLKTKFIGSQGDISSNEGIFLFFYPTIKELEGKILTIIDASIQDPVQRKALKDVIRPMMWTWIANGNMISSYELTRKKTMR